MMAIPSRLAYRSSRPARSRDICRRSRGPTECSTSMAMRTGANTSSSHTVATKNACRTPNTTVLTSAPARQTYSHVRPNARRAAGRLRRDSEYRRVTRASLQIGHYMVS